MAHRIVDYLVAHANKLTLLQDTLLAKNLFHLIAKNKPEHSSSSSSKKVGDVFTVVLRNLSDPTRKYLTAWERTMNVLHMAVLNRHYEIVQALCERDEYFRHLNQPTLDKLAEWPVHLAAKLGSIECFELLLAGKADITSRTAKNDNILHVAVANNQYEFIRYLIAQPIIYDRIERMAIEKNDEYMLPLEYAIYLGHLEAARVVEVRTSWTHVNLGSPLSLFHVCVRAGRLEALEYLFQVVEKKFGVEEREKMDFVRSIVSMVSHRHENTIFHLAASRCQPDLMCFLLEKCDESFIERVLCHRNRDELTCFHISCIKGCLFVFSFL